MNWAEIEGVVEGHLVQRLDVASDRPIAVAFSGGGDSLALLITAHAWARRAGRSVVCLTVDHGLSRQSADWNRWCGRRAQSLGVEHRVLAWTGPKPATGVAAAARAARHRLLANAARDAGASVILMGHTADDRFEARLMREEGCNVTEPRLWSPSPSWPDGRRVFLLRPLIDIRREAIRDALRAMGETWLDDPANSDPISLRARVRVRIASDGGSSRPAVQPSACPLLGAVTVGWAGDVAIALSAMIGAPEASRVRFLRAALCSAAGSTSAPRGAAIGRLWERLSRDTSVAATLAGARIERNGDAIRIMRDDGAMRSLATEAPDDRIVFDGRFELGGSVGRTLTSMQGHMSRLSRTEQATLRTAPPAARRALPAWVNDRGEASCPAIPQSGRQRARNLVASRLAAALGALTTEASIGRVGETALGVLDRLASIERYVHEPA